MLGQRFLPDCSLNLAWQLGRHVITYSVNAVDFVDVRVAKRPRMAQENLKTSAMVPARKHRHFIAPLPARIQAWRFPAGSSLFDQQRHSGVLPAVLSKV